MNENMQSIIAKITQKKSYKIVFLGDSLTSAEWVHPNWREIIEYVLKEEMTAALDGDWKTSEWFIRCINCGFDGANSQDLLNLLDNEVLIYEPDLVISLWGGNDLHAHLTPQQHRHNIEKLLAWIPSQKVFCSSLPYLRPAYNDKYAPLVEEVEKLFTQPQANTQFIDLFKIYPQRFQLDKAFNLINVGGNVDLEIKPGEIDHAHPGPLGNAYIAQILLNEIWGIKFDAEKFIVQNGQNIISPDY